MAAALPVSASIAALPANAEEALLGALLIDPDGWAKIADLVTAADFVRADHRTIFTAIAAIAGDNRSVDGFMVVNELHREGRLEHVGGADYIAGLIDTANSEGLLGYARLVREDADQRRFVGGLQDALRLARDGSVEAASDTALETVARAVPARSRSKPLTIEPASVWAGRAEPAPRDMIIEAPLSIPGGRVTSFIGNGGLGKTLIALQVAVHVAMSRPIFGMQVNGGPVLGIFCEDEQDELQRRVRAACVGERIDLEDLQGLFALSRDGLDNLLCTFERDQIKLTRFYAELEATIEDIKPRLVILDTAADLFAGDFMSTPHVRQFIKVALGGLCVRHGCAILLLAHPSAAGMSSGDGGGFSTAWNNSVRSRLYLRRPKSKNPDDVTDRRIVEVRKANYARDGGSVPLIYQNGYFVPDIDPLDESASDMPIKAPTKLAFAALTYIRDKGIGGMVISFRDIFEEMRRRGEIPIGEKYDVARKPLYRALKQLEREELIKQTQTPKGYRLPSGQALAP